MKNIYVDTLGEKRNNSIPYKWAELKRKDILKAFLNRLEGKIEKIEVVESGQNNQVLTFNEFLALFDSSLKEIDNDTLRKLFNIPENRYYTVSNNQVLVEKTRFRKVEVKKISKSN